MLNRDCSIYYVRVFIRYTHLYRVFQKQHEVNGTIILQPYVSESCGFQQNVQKNSSNDKRWCLNTANKYFFCFPASKTELFDNSINRYIFKASSYWKKPIVQSQEQRWRKLYAVFLHAIASCRA